MADVFAFIFTVSTAAGSIVTLPLLNTNFETATVGQYADQSVINSSGASYEQLTVLAAAAQFVQVARVGGTYQVLQFTDASTAIPSSCLVKKAFTALSGSATLSGTFSVTPLVTSGGNPTLQFMVNAGSDSASATVSSVQINIRGTGVVTYLNGSTWCNGPTLAVGVAYSVAISLDVSSDIQNTWALAITRNDTGGVVFSASNINTRVATSAPDRIVFDGGINTGVTNASPFVQIDDLKFSSSTYVPPIVPVAVPNATLAPLGDSRTAIISYDTAGMNMSSQSHLNWANALTRQQFPLTGNFGTSGATSDYIVANNLASALATHPTFMTILMGVNDTTVLGYNAAQTMANIAKAADAAIAQGTIPIIFTDPGNSATLTNGSPAMDANATAFISDVNARIANYCSRHPQAVMFDLASLISTQRTPLIIFKPGWSYDGIHLQTLGAYSVGLAFAEFMNTHFILPTPTYPGFSGNLLSNSDFSSSSGGTVGTGNTGTVPTSYSGLRDNAITTTSFSVNTREDGTNEIVAVLTTGSLGSGMYGMKILQTIPVIGLNPGDTFQAGVQVEIDAGSVSLADVRVELDLAFGDQTFTNAYCFESTRYRDSISSLPGAPALSLTMLSPVSTYSTGKVLTSMKFVIGARMMNNTSNGNATIRFRNPWCKKIAQLPATPIPNTPEGLIAVSGPGMGQISLSWTTTAEAEGYVIQRSSISETDGYTNLATVSSGTTYVDSDPGLASGQIYYYQIAASNASGTSNFSNSVSAGPYVPPGFQGWVYSHFGINPSPTQASYIATPANDGIANLIKYAIGLDPFSAYSSLSPGMPVSEIVKSGSSQYLGLSFSGTATDVIYSVQATNDFKTWSTVYSSITGQPPGAIIVSDTVPLSSGVNRFMRLQITMP